MMFCIGFISGSIFAGLIFWGFPILFTYEAKND